MNIGNAERLEMAAEIARLSELLYEARLQLASTCEALEALADARNWHYQGRFDPNSSNFNGIETARNILTGLGFVKVTPP